MKYISEFQNQQAVQILSKRIHAIAEDRRVTLMEVCGTHTMAIARYGIRSLLPENLRLISGPGCPVCVTSTEYIDHAIALANVPDTIISTFGDMMRVPGSESSLEEEHGKGAQIHMVPSTLEALALAKANPDKKVIFLGIGFETTIPTVGAAILSAQKQNLENFFVLSAHKIMPPAMRALCLGNMAVDGFLCPGHVSTITGLDIYYPIVEEFGKGCVIAGFEPTDILQSILMLCEQIHTRTPKVENQYRRSVRPEGNPQAKAVIDQVFETCDAEWRGLGVIPVSGLKIKADYQALDAAVRFQVDVPPAKDPEGCRCGDVLTGHLQPQDCGLFGKICTPDSPVGACMVSSEGSCAAAHRFRDGRDSF